MPEVIHQAEMVVGIGVPRPVDLERARGLAAIGVAQIRRDAAVFVLELLHRVERVVREARDRRVQPAAGDHQQREAGAGLFVMDADVAFFVERHGGFSSVGRILAEYAFRSSALQYCIPWVMHHQIPI